MNKIESATNQVGDCPNDIAQAPPAENNQKAEKVPAGGCLPRPCSAEEERFILSDWLVNSAMFQVHQNALERVKEGKMKLPISMSVTLRPNGGSINFDLLEC